MAGLSSPGIGSGLDINSLISRLMEAERLPLTALENKEKSYNTKISALGSLKSVLTAAQTAAEGLVPASGTTAVNKYTSTRATLSDTSLGSATATNSAAAGSHTLSDITLASAQQLSKSGMSIPAGAGTLNIKVGDGTAVNVSIGANATLASMRDAINASSAGVSASILNDGSSDVLVLKSKNSGAANTITMTGSAGFEDFNYAAGSANSWTQDAEAKNASVKIDGITVSSASNSISTAIEGVTLTLAKESATGTTLTIAKDNSGITSSLNTFIKAFNDAATTMKSLGAYNSTTKTAATLTGDSTLRSTQNQLNTLLFSSSSAGGNGLQRLSDLGVNLQLDGTLKLDSTKLNAAINSNFEGVANLVADVGSRFKATLDSMVGPTGSVNSKIDGIKSTIKSLDQRQEALQLKLAKVEERYRRQFTALDTQISNMQALSSRLASQLASLPSINSN
ncbi:MAG: flagellar hook-associated protein [Proteobacteria bacterium]|nr:flagellar hook-associated protein [Pseudomonadota bacterium]